MRPLDLFLTLRFVDVGREKRTWTAKIPATGDAMNREVSKHGGLRSRDIQCEYDVDAGVGSIYAGMHMVGRIERGEEV